MVKNKEKCAITLPNNSKSVYEQYQHLIPYPNIEIPLEHRSKKDNIHSLRCFKMIYQRDSDKQKLKDEPKVRCKRHVEEGYLYCKLHGGKKTDLVKTVKGTVYNDRALIYKNVYDSGVCDLLEAFLNDPKITDVKPELASLKAVMYNYIKKVSEPPKASNIRQVMNRVTDIALDTEKSLNKKFTETKILMDSLESISDGRVVDRISRCIESISRVMERIRKYETSDEFMLTPDGLKIMLRSIVELIDSTLGDDENIKEKIRDGLLKLSVKTKGDLSKIDTLDSVDAEIVE